jgi:3-oxoacyl-[acyl-carrier protein] reductase
MGELVALVTGVGRSAGIGAAVVERLAADGYDVAWTAWRPYDQRMPWGADEDCDSRLHSVLGALGRRSASLEVDLADPTAPSEVFDTVTSTLGAPTAMVLCHCESVDGSIDDTTPESFDRHLAVNATATWLLIREYARRSRAPHGTGRIVAFTSDHTAHNVAYGASKGALDRVVLAAARELAGRGVSCNVINPGPTDTGWMTPQLIDDITRHTPLGRVGTPADAANLVSFLCSPNGAWINGQLLHSNGGWTT